jgi:FkbM family methyltransferase
MGYDVAAVQTLLGSMIAHGKVFVHDWLELATEKYYLGILETGDSAVDVGAHRGRHTIPMLRRVGPTGQVYAIEAASTTLNKLRAAINHCGIPYARRNIIVHPVAASDAAGEAEFVFVPAAAGLSGLKTEFEPGSTRERVEVQRIDDLIPDDSRVRFIKLDIEGAELPALRGALRLLTRCRPCLAFENGGLRYQARFNYTSEDFFGFFDQIGYIMYTPLGTIFDRSWKNGPQPHQIFAAPRERMDLVTSVLAPACIDALQEMYAERAQAGQTAGVDAA